MLLEGYDKLDMVGQWSVAVDVDEIEGMVGCETWASGDEMVIGLMIFIKHRVLRISEKANFIYVIASEFLGLSDTAFAVHFFYLIDCVSIADFLPPQIPHFI